ncbi:MAG: RNA polymerase sigma-70 factor [Bacteroidia bacterium]|nr:RNA polymerase sigma-70 factor [Bacteroidia bacterium]
MLTGSDSQILEAIKRDDNGAYEMVFREYYRPMTAYAFRFLNDLSDSESIVQDVFLRLWQKRMEIMIASSLQNYLFRSVKNQCINHIEHEKIKTGYQVMVIKNETDRSEYSEFFLEFGLKRKIETAIAALPEKRQEIFRLARENGLKYREIADRLEISVKTVETQMTLALKQLRESLKEYKNLVMFFLCNVRGK